jgi:hypothetical protein
VVLQPDGSFATLPIWMTEPAACCHEISSNLPRFSLRTLREMRAEVDALLSFLLSDSKTETGDHGAKIRKSSTKSAGLGATARDAVPQRA